MQNTRGVKEKFVQEIINLIYKVLRKERLLQSEYHLGTVDSVVSPTQLNVFIDGSTTYVTCPCNPDVTFTTGDSVLVIFINNNSNSRFVLCKRGI